MKKIGSIIIGIIIIILGIVLLNSNNDSEVIIDNETESEVMVKISVQHDFKDGKHIIHGLIEAPTPCHKLSVTSQRAIGIGDEANEVAIDITLTDTARGCVMAVEDKPFFYSFEAPEDVRLIATYNGEPALLDIIELEEGEYFDLADFMFKE